MCFELLVFSFSDYNKNYSQQNGQLSVGKKKHKIVEYLAGLWNTETPHKGLQFVKHSQEVDVNDDDNDSNSKVLLITTKYMTLINTILT